MEIVRTHGFLRKTLRYHSLDIDDFLKAIASGSYTWKCVHQPGRRIRGLLVSEKVRIIGV